MNDYHPQVDELARELDRVIPPGHQKINAGAGNPLLEAALDFARTPFPELNPQVMARIEQQVLEAYVPPPGVVRFSSGRRWFAATASLIVMFIVAGLALVVSDSLPGSPFYPLKRGIEQFQLFVTSDPLPQASVYLDHAEQRLDESSTLLAKGEFNGELFSAALDNAKNSIRIAVTEASLSRITALTRRLEDGLETAQAAGLVTPNTVLPLQSQIESLRAMTVPAETPSEAVTVDATMTEELASPSGSPVTLPETDNSSPIAHTAAPVEATDTPTQIPPSPTITAVTVIPTATRTPTSTMIAPVPTATSSPAPVSNAANVAPAAPPDDDESSQSDNPGGNNPGSGNPGNDKPVGNAGTSIPGNPNPGDGNPGQQDNPSPGGGNPRSRNTGQGYQESTSVLDSGEGNPGQGNNQYSLDGNDNSEANIQFSSFTGQDDESSPRVIRARDDWNIDGMWGSNFAADPTMNGNTRSVQIRNQSAPLFDPGEGYIVQSGSSPAPVAGFGGGTAGQPNTPAAQVSNPGNNNGGQSSNTPAVTSRPDGKPVTQGNIPPTPVSPPAPPDNPGQNNPPAPPDNPGQGNPPAPPDNPGQNNPPAPPDNPGQNNPPAPPDNPGGNNSGQGGKP